MKKGTSLAGIELGPKRFTAAVGQMEEGRLRIQAVDSVPAQGFEKEGLSDPIECADGVARLLRQTERAVGEKIPAAVIAFPANHLKSANASATIPIPEPGAGITRQDVEKVISTCRTLSLEYDRKILHAFERGFTVDGQSGVRNPVGLSGRKLVVELHLVTALSLTVQNLSRVINRSGLEVDDFVLPGVACGEAVLSDLDRDLGVTLVRIGDFLTEAVLYNDGEVRETFLIPGGMDDLAEHLSRTLRLPRVAAERLLGQVSSLEERPEGNSVPLQAGPAGPARSIPEPQVVQLVRHRCRELLQKLRRRLATSPIFLDCASGVVMVGSLARLEGFLEMAEEFLNVPVRLGAVKEVELSPGFDLRQQDVTAVGLLRYGMRRRMISVQPAALTGWLKPLERFRQVLQEYF